MPTEEETFDELFHDFQCSMCFSTRPPQALGVLGSRYYVVCEDCGAQLFKSAPEEDCDNDFLGD